MNLFKRTSALLVAALVLGAAGCGKSSSDSAITSRVKAAISNEPALKATKVSVSTDQKVVHLSGTLKSRDERAMLIAVARKVEGVAGVTTDLVVTPQPKTVVEAKPKTKPVAQARAKPERRAQQRLKPQPAAEFPGTGR